MTKNEFDNLCRRLRDGLIVDRNALDECCERHAQLYLEASEAAVHAASLSDEAKTAMEICYSERATVIRRKLEKSTDRYTEGVIKEAVVVDEKYLASVVDFDEARKQTAILRAIVSAYEQRAKMLGKLGDLYVSGYFALNSVRGSRARTSEADAQIARNALAGERENRRPLLKKRS